MKLGARGLKAGTRGLLAPFAIALGTKTFTPGVPIPMGFRPLFDVTLALSSIWDGGEFDAPQRAHLSIIGRSWGRSPKILLGVHPGDDFAAAPRLCRDEGTHPSPESVRRFP